MAGGVAKVKMQNKDSNDQEKKNKEKKKKGKDDTVAVEAITNALKALPQEQQIATLLLKYGELYEENKTLQSSCRSLERSAQQAQKEKDKVELEHSKAVLTRSRLESLCRELQRQNKIIKDENVVRMKEEEERRKEVSNQFNSTLSEISHLMEENTQKNSKLREDNEQMASRLLDLVNQHEQREDHVEKILKQRELETQLAEAKLAKLQIEVKEQKEKMLTDRKGLLEELSTLQDKLQEKAITEISLRTQLNSYTEKFEDFQGTLDKSNQVFNGFKKEIDDMSKTIKILEKEAKLWKEKCESANVALCKMFTERSQMETKIESLNKQNVQLQSLCRSFQQQIKDLRIQIRNKGVQETSSPSSKNQVNDNKPSRLTGGTPPEEEPNRDETEEREKEDAASAPPPPPPYSPGEEGKATQSKGRSTAGEGETSPTSKLSETSNSGIVGGELDMEAVD